MTKTKKESKFTIGKIIKWVFLFFIGGKIFSAIRQEIYPSRFPDLQETNPYFSNNANFNIEIWLMKDSKKESMLLEQKNLSYNFDPSLPVEVSVPLNSEMKKNPQKYSIRSEILFYEAQKGKHSIKAESPILISKDREIIHKSEHSEIKKLTLTSKKGNFSYLSSKLYFVLVNDQKSHYFENERFNSYLYRNNQIKTPSNDFFYMPIFNGNQWWLLDRYLLSLDELDTQYPAETTFPGSEEPKYNDRIQILFWVTCFKKFEWTEHLKLSEEQNMFPELNVFNEFKALLLDNTPIYLFILFSVNFFHSLFSMLSIRHNVIFLRNLSDSTGLSVSGAYFDVLSNLLAILYLIDNDTNKIVILMSILELFFFIWKALKLSSAALVAPQKKELSPEEQVKLEQKKTTESTDRKTAKYLFSIFIPIYTVYLAYSVYFHPPENRMYSFVLEKAVAFNYVIGFVFMFPQVVINYTLKSVEYMPWKVLMYKFFNTIIDDLFAFAVKMPALKRLSCFRDDVVFVIFLIQWWLYRNNKKRGTQVYQEEGEKLLNEKKEQVTQETLK